MTPTSGQRPGKRRYNTIQKLAKAWNNFCAICGNEFTCIESVTIDHMIPKSKGGLNGDNKVPAHWRCNQMKGNLSLFDAIKLIEQKRQHIVRSNGTNGQKAFVKWLNAWEPSRRKQMRRMTQEANNLKKVA